MLYTRFYHNSTNGRRFTVLPLSFTYFQLLSEREVVENWDSAGLPSHGRLKIPIPGRVHLPVSASFPCGLDVDVVSFVSLLPESYLK